MDKDLIESAKNHARKSGKSLSKLVSEYFYLLDKTNRQQNEPLPPVVRQLKGLLKGSGLDEADYKKYLENKYL
jgi:hypothetical protein